MSHTKRTRNIRRYRNMPMDALLALLSDNRDEDFFVAFRAQTRRSAR